MASAPDETFTVKVNGEAITIDPGDFDRFEWRALKEAVGKTQVELFTSLAELDLDTIAAMVWVCLRREQPDLAFDDVNLRLSDLYDEQDTTDPPD